MQELQDDILWPVSSVTVMTPVPYGLHNYELVLSQAKEDLHLLYFCGYWDQARNFLVKRGEQEMMFTPCAYTQRPFSVYVVHVTPPTAKLASLDSSPVVTHSQVCAPVYCLSSCTDFVHVK